MAEIRAAARADLLSVANHKVQDLNRRINVLITVLERMHNDFWIAAVVQDTKMEQLCRTAIVETTERLLDMRIELASATKEVKRLVDMG